MLSVYSLLANLLKWLLNVLFFIQIALMIIVFLTASYWLCDLLNIGLFSFAQPIVDVVLSLVKNVYRNEIILGGTFIDGSLLLFDVTALLVVFGLTKLKYYINRGIDNLNDLIAGCKKKIEANFNKQLQHEAEKSIKKSGHVAIMVKFELKDISPDAFYNKDNENNVKEKENEAFKIFYSSLKDISGCKFAQSDGKMLILLDDFKKVDNLLHFIDSSIIRIRENMKSRRWLLLSYTALDVYENMSDLKESVYPSLDKLLKIKHKNDMICFGNFKVRYEVEKDTIYSLFSKGKYNIDGEEYDIWSLVKKN